jgi:hypothetical protein
MDERAAQAGTEKSPEFAGIRDGAPTAINLTDVGALAAPRMHISDFLSIFPFPLEAALSRRASSSTIIDSVPPKVVQIYEVSLLRSWVPRIGSLN